MKDPWRHFVELDRDAMLIKWRQMQEALGDATRDRSFRGLHR